MKNEENCNGDKKLISIVGLIVWRWGTGIAVLVAAYGAMWVKTNAPSRIQFESLTTQVQGLREDMIRFSNQAEKLSDIRLRQDKMDDRLIDMERRLSGPPRRPSGTP